MLVLNLQVQYFYNTYHITTETQRYQKRKASTYQTWTEELQKLRTCKWVNGFKHNSRVSCMSGRGRERRESVVALWLDGPKVDF